MHDVTLALAVILAAGFATAKLGQLIRLPSVTGFICAGLLLGPSALNLITEEAIIGKLDHFTQIALMLIAFGIGKHLEIERLRRTAKSVGYIGISETLGAFLFVSAGTFFVALITGVGEPTWKIKDFLALAMLLGAVSVATAPAATLHVMRELKAAGPLTTTLMAVVAIDDGLAIMFFGIAVSAARHIVGSELGSIGVAVISSLTEIIFSLLMGVITGLIIDFVIHRLRRRGEMLTVGLALLLLCGEAARLLDLSPLLAGMAVGFTIVNRDRRDVRLFKAINHFEPPIYVLFFTLAGSHLNLSALVIAGWVGLVYFLLRAFGKFIGCNIGGRLAAAAPTVTRLLGLALIPQAGVAIGLIFLIKNDAALGAYSSIIIPVVLGGIVLSELTGPVCARFAVEKAGEAAVGAKVVKAPGTSVQRDAEPIAETDGIRLVPWTWERLKPPQDAEGAVIFGLSLSGSGPGLARMATLLAHYYRARPTAVRVLSPGPDKKYKDPDLDSQALFDKVASEVRALGYELDTKIVENENVADGILSAAHTQKTSAIILGHPLVVTIQEFNRVVEAVARDAPCQVIVVRFAGVLHTERILVPVVDMKNLGMLADIVRSLSGVGEHSITLLTMVHASAFEEELEEVEEILLEWVEKENLTPFVRCRAVATEARSRAIVNEAAQHDLIIMAASPTRGLRRLFFGSLAEDVAQHCQKPMLIVHS
ncbi:MAG: cation:proton antiporter [Desulfobacterales bacterium]|nr:cation:proton antiporter [Desulfobacterales bacterium]